MTISLMIKLIKSTFYNENKTKKKLVDFITKSKVLSMSEECSKFEKSFAEKQERKYAVFVTSGSSANLVLIQSLLNLGRLKKGDKVGFSALTWATNVMPLIQLGLVPVPIDCEVETLNISTNTLLDCKKNLDALFITNVLGFCDDLDKIEKYCLENDILLIEDNCEALGSKFSGKLLGNFGLASTASFFVGHHMSTIEGGMICTDDEELHTMLLATRAHGWDRNLSENKQQQLRTNNKVDDFFARYTFYDLAYNARPTEINGFIGNAQLGYWDEIVEKRENNFKKFQTATEGNNDFISLRLGHMEVVSNFAMPVVCKDLDLFQKYKNKFKKANIEIRPIIAGDMTKQPFYKKYIDDSADCKNADFVHKNGFYFPNNPELSSGDINLLCSLLEK